MTCAVSDFFQVRTGVNELHSNELIGRKLFFSCGNLRIE